MEVVFYVEVEGVIWKVLNDGAWVQIDAAELVSVDLPMLIATTPESAPQPTINTQDDEELSEVIEELVNVYTDQTITSSNTNTISTPDFVSNSGLVLIGFVRPKLDETLPQSGFQTLGTQHGNDDTQSNVNDDTFILSSSATISVTIEDGGDGYENRFEIPVVTILGTTLDIRNGIAVEITVTDVNGNSEVLQAVVQNNQYQLSNVNLSSLEEGQLIVTAKVVDSTGSSISAADNTVKDTLANIEGELDGFGDVTVNQVEQSQDILFGTVDNVENDQAIIINVRDINGNVLTFETVVKGSGWLINDVDLTSLQDGVLTVTSETIDIAGNPAVDVTTIIKDTLAEITIEFDDGGDNVLNIEERQDARIFGVVNNVEDGQRVIINVEDSTGASMEFETIVIDQQWQVIGANLSNFVEGKVTAIASTVDLAGNPANATDTTSIDTTIPTIDIDTLDGFDVYYFREGTLKTIQGSTTGVDEGLPVTVILSDGTTSLEFVTVVDALGDWVTTDLDVSALDSRVGWTMNALVANSVGNQVADDMPTLEIPDRVVMSETFVGIFGSDSTSSEINIEGATFKFNDTQDPFISLMSSDQILSFTLSANKQDIEFTRADGEVVLKANIDADKVEISLFQGLEAGRTGDLQTELLIKGTQNDVDGTAEEVIAPVIITVQDSRPLAIDDYYTKTEAEISTGNLLSNDEDLDGGLQVRSVSIELDAGTDSQTVAPGTPAVFDLPEGKLLVYASGQWILEAARNLDHTQSQNIQLLYRVGDDSVEFDYANATIHIIDGEQGSIGSGQSLVQEGALNLVDEIGAGSIKINSGSDNPDPDSIAFDPATLATLNSLNLTSGESYIPLSFELSDDGKSITGYVNTIEIITMSLSTHSVGDDMFIDSNITLHLPINQDASTDITYLPVKITGSDTDGTPLISGDYTWQIQDGTNPTLLSNTTISVSEDELTALTLNKVGSFDVTVGSDPITRAYFDITDFPTLSSEGLPIYYTLTPNGNVVTAYQESVKGDVVFILYFDAPEGKVNETLNYTLLIDKALDEVNGNDTLNFPITFVDSDGDATNLDLVVTISDATGGSITVSDMSVSERSGNSVLVGENTDTDSAQIMVEASKDPIVAIKLAVNSGDIVFDSNGNPLTQNGESIFWRENGDGTYVGELSDGTSIFVVTLPDEFMISPDESAKATIDFLLREQVDHDQLGQRETLLLTLPIAAVDSDGTELDAQSTVTIYDGKFPSISVLGSISVVEDGLIGDNEERGTEQNDPSLSVITGSDDVVEFLVDIAEFNALGIESSGQPVTLTEKNDSGWYIAENPSNQEVFRIRLLESGNVDFELSRPLDHETALSTNNLVLDFQVAAIDYDGDISDYETLTINVTDDVPQVRESEIELVEGDDVTENMLTPFYAGADGATIQSASYQGNEVSNFIDGKLNITLYMPGTTIKYGELIIYQDGTFKLKTNEFVDNNVPVRDEVSYVVIDSDGDTVTSTAKLILDDAKGVIRTPSVEMREDDIHEIGITVILGDLDQGEVVESITISEESLKGGILSLDGVELIASGGDVTLSGTQLEVLINDIYIPNGALTYQPNENQSNSTQTVVLDVEALVRNDDLSSKTLTSELTISVLPVADTPIWDADSVFIYDLIEDSETSNELNLSASLFDTDSSETLTFQISNIPDKITLFLNGEVVKESKDYTQAQLDKITFEVDENLAGVFTFDVTAISTEKGNNFASADDEMASTTQTVTINVSPDADQPELSVRNIAGLEDELLSLNDAIKGSLTDLDGSEALYYEIVVLEGWGLSGGGFVETAPNTYLVEASGIENDDVKLIPKLDISSVTKQLSIDVTAVAIESEASGLTPINVESRSDTKTVIIDLKGVIDEPDVIDGGNNHWQFDSEAGSHDGEITAAVPFDEDNLIALDFLVITSDDDGSEVINVLLTDIPNNVRLVDVDGNPIELTIAEIDPVSGPVIQIDNDLLSQVYLKPEQDFSGQLALTILAITTEPDGDTGEFVYDLKVDVKPVVDQSDGQVVSTHGIEDRNIALNLELVINADIDGSESLVGYVIDSVDEGITLFFDDVAQTIPAGGIDLVNWVDTQSPTLDILLSSGRISVKTDRDLSGDFDIQLRYSIEDTSETGLTTIKELSGVAHLQIDGRVEYDTRLESTTRLLESTDGSAIDLSDAVWFIEEDIDGSEFLDYIVIEVPDGSNLIVEHPNGASQNANGDWIISAEGLTSDSVQDVMVKILQDATIRSLQNTDIITIGVKARVLDDPDAEFISTQFDIRVTGHDGGGGGCGEVGEPGDITTNDDIQFNEGETIDLSGLLDPDIASDPDNQLSFYIPADNLPEEVYLEGDGVITEYNSDGTIAGYSVSTSALSALTLYGVDEDFAGFLEFTVNTIETSTCNGSSKETENIIKIEILPIVDEFSMLVGDSMIQEDILTDINLALILGDSLEAGQDITGEGTSATGKETVQSMTITVTEGVVLSDVSGESSYIQDNGDNTYTITDATRLGDIALTPPAHFSGNLTLSVTTTIMDQADGISEIDVQTKTSEFNIVVEPVADQANLIVSDVIGDEDSYISLAGLSAELVDQDGSENLSLSIVGVPTDAVLVLKVGADYQLLPNNGVDGGSFAGEPTYEWQLQADQLSNVYLLPPLDFSGDIPITLEAITQEIGTMDIRYTTASFTIGVNPVGDDIQFFDVPTEVSGKESDSIVISTNLESQEINSDERIQLTVIAEAMSDPSALIGLNRIRANGSEAKFTENADGSWVASLIVTASALASFELFAGDAFGHLNLTLEANTIDSSFVLGSREIDIGPTTTASLSVDITPQPDEPELFLEFESIVAEAAGLIPLGLTMDMINPALPDETGTLFITGLPENLEFNAGELINGRWEVSVDDVAGLAIKDGYDGAQNFSLALEANSELGGESVTAAYEVLDVALVAVGDGNINATSANDYLIGGSGNDTFTFLSEGVGSSEAPTLDVINDFEYTINTDRIDLSEIFSGLNLATGEAAQNYVMLEEVGNSVNINLNTKLPDPGQSIPDIDQTIVLTNVSFDELYGIGASFASQADLLQKMIDDNNLIMV